jgi:hypothetical protein
MNTAKELAAVQEVLSPFDGRRELLETNDSRNSTESSNFGLRFRVSQDEWTALQ